MFDVEDFVAQCKVAVTQNDGQQIIRDLLERSVSDPSQIIATFGEPTQADVHKLYASSNLTILHLIWGPHMMLMPHNHQMWAVIGIYTGREDNIFWRRIDGDKKGTLRAAGARSLAAKDVESLGPDAIHSVTNPLKRLTGAIHVYGGDFFGAPRSEWDPEFLEEGPFDLSKNLQLFEESNKRS